MQIVKNFNKKNHQKIFEGEILGWNFEVHFEGAILGVQFKGEIYEILGWNFWRSAWFFFISPQVKIRAHPDFIHPEF